MEPLKLETTQGDFVHKNQVMSSDDGFKCVSKIWFDKTKTIEQGLEAIAADAAIRNDLMVPASNFRVEHRGNVAVLVLDGVDYNPTEHAWKQLAGGPVTNIGHTIVNTLRAPVVYGKNVTERDAKDAELLASCFMNGHRRLEPKKIFRFRVDENMVCRAVLTEDYSPIDNRWYLETLQELFTAIGGTEPRLSHWRGNSDTMYGNLLLPDSCLNDTDSDYGGMVTLSNCEIGRRRLEQYPSIFRAICMNGCIWDQVKGTAISKVHRGQINLIDLKERILKNVNESIPMMPTIIARFLKTKEWKLDKTPVAKVVAQICKDYRLTPKQATEIMTQFKNHEMEFKSLFGVINAITRAGQVFDNDSWVAFDTIGGELAQLEEKQFNTLKDKANLLSDKEVLAAFGQSA